MIYVSLIVSCVAALLAGFSSLATVQAGNVGVVTLFGKVDRNNIAEGMHIINPFSVVTEMSTKVQKAEEKHDAASKDMQNVHAQFTLNYRLLATKATSVYQKIGMDYAAIIITPATQEVLKAVLARYAAAEILHERHKIKTEVQTDLAKWLIKYGIKLEECAIANIGFDGQYEQAIKNKQVREQVAEQKRYELVQAEREAQIAAAKAKGEADAVREQAKGAADALEVRGAAEEKYNRRVAASLSSTLLRQQYLTRWNGALPQYLLGENTAILLQQGQ
jgi:prohibitin 2